MFVFDTMLGRVAHYGTLPGADDSIILVPFEASTLIDDDLRTAISLEELTLLLTESPIGRLTATSAYAVNGVAGLFNTGWLSPTYGPEITRVIICYKPTSTSLDADIVPMVSLDVSWTPDSIQDFFINLEAGYFEATGFNYV